MVAGLAASAAGAGVAARAASQPSVYVKFRTPSGNIGCAGSVAMKGLPSFLRCDILSGLRPRPAGPCELDWTGFSFQGRGRARPACAGDTVYDSYARVVRYGKTWKQAPFTCKSRRTALRCTNASGQGFVLGRTRSHRF